MSYYSLTLFQGRAGDRNHHGFSGAALVAQRLSEVLSADLSVVGTPETPLNSHWQEELLVAETDLLALANHYEFIIKSNSVPVTVMPRCAAGLATLPKIAEYFPDACIIWFDAHADLNTPEHSTSGYLGGMVISGAAGLWYSGLGGGLNLNQVVLAGVRDIDLAEEITIANHNITNIPACSNAATQVKEAVGNRPVYIHIDCDVFNAGIVPSEFQVAGGFSLAEFSAILSGLSANKLVGLEIAEFQGIWEHNNEPATPNHLVDSILPLFN